MSFLRPGVIEQHKLQLHGAVKALEHQEANLSNSNEAEVYFDFTLL